MYKHICKLCGNEYDSKMPHGNVCNDCKNRPCEVCGKNFLRDWPYDQRTCSPECRHKLRTDPANIAQKEAKKKAHLMEKYGVDNVSKLPEVKKKLSDYSKSEEFQKHFKEVSLAKYGVDHPSKAKEVVEKRRKTFIERYGTENPAKSDEIRKKISERLKDPEVRQHYINTCLEHYGVPHPNLVPEVVEKRKETCIRNYGVPYYVMSTECKSGQATNQISLANRAFAELLQTEYGLQTEFEYRIDTKLYDLHIEGSNILIEIDPSYTHSDLPNHWCNGLDPKYHAIKSQLAEDNGFHCIHVFDWDNLTKIAKLVQNKSIVYARKCSLKQIDRKTASEFINKFHLQGDAKGAKRCYGLYDSDGRLLQVMTFGKPRYNNNYQWELLRLCSDSEFKVVGGASKMFNQFIKDENPESILSYCDKAKFSGKVYEKLGMKLHHVSPPAKIWSRDTDYITDNLLRQRGYDQLFNTSYGKGTSNEELMIENGWRSVYDCGQLVYEWRRNRA